MEFGYFTLSDNHYAGNPRNANAYHRDIIDEAIFAEQVGLNSAWIGEHHFSSLGVTSCPDVMLAYVAARTSRIRLAPAVNVLPLHHPIRVAEQWATLDLLSDGRVDFASGRGYDRHEYEPFHADFENNTGLFHEGMEVVRRLWTEDQPVTHKGEHFSFENVSITPKPVQKPIPTYVACFSRPTVEFAGANDYHMLVAPFAAAMQFGGLAEVAEVYREAAVKAGKKPGRMMCSYFIHLADTPEEDTASRERQMRYFQECITEALPSDPAKTPPTYRYFLGMVEGLGKMKPTDLGDNSVLLGPPDRIIETLKKVEAAGIDEVILYFNVGMKPHSRVKEEMQRFMEEIAPSFEGKHRALAAAQ